MNVDKMRDPIHGFIDIREGEKKIIDSAPFQRLRNIKQLAMTYYIYPGAEHTRFGHSIGVMHLVTRAFQSATEGDDEHFPPDKRAWYEQILRLIALTHDIGHAPFSHASESVFPDGLEHEDYTVDIIKNTIIADIICEIGEDFRRKHGEQYDITPELICDIYMGIDSGPNSEYSFLKSFMDSELDCDKMDYLLRDAYYCGVKYGVYDVERLISSFTIVYKDSNTPRLAIKSGGVQAFEEFVLARYFMFIEVYFHRTRRYFDIMLVEALKDILPNGVYPKDVEEYLRWDDCRVIQCLKEKCNESVACKNIMERRVYPQIFQTKVHPTEADKREFKRNLREIKSLVGEDNVITDRAGKVPHKIPIRGEIDDEKSIIIYDKNTERKTTISEESELIRNLYVKIDISRVYCHPDRSDEARNLMKDINLA